MILIAPPKGAIELETYINWLKAYQVDFKILTEDIEDITQPLLLCGGADVGKNKNRDDMEFKWIDSAVKNNQPIIGICRGMQILNLYFGGSVEDMSDIITESHRLDTFEDDADHSERISQYHFICDEFGNTSEVNSRHHQYCSKVADNFKVTHTSLAGGNIPEAFEDETRRIYAVQWHPERMECVDNQTPLFKIF